MSDMDYLEFLKSKIEIVADSGFEVAREEINPALKPHQADAVVWALRGGRRALFESFGLGKTIQEIEFCHQTVKRFGGKALIVCPLGVKQEFSHDAVQLLGYDAPVYVRNMEDVSAAKADILITNYERVRDGDIQPDYFTATSLDEASVLRSFGSKTYQTFLDKFKGVPYKLVATATPSPNKYKELIHYAGYLEVMDTGQALTRFFQRDSTKANNLTLYPNQEDEFWLWVSSWALFVTKPSDVNPEYSDDGYVLPPLEVRWHELPIEYGDTTDRDGQFQLFNDAAAGLKEAGAYMAVEMESEQAQKTFRKLTEILGFQAKGQEPEKPLVEFPVPELMRFPGMDSAEQEMEEGPEVYTELDGEKESDGPEVPLIEPSTGYGGFLYIKCPDCGEIKGFCAKVRINNFRCGCGSVTRLEHLVPLYMNCECGRKSRYLTNMNESAFDMTCYDCGSPVAIVWNDKKKQYETMKED